MERSDLFGESSLLLECGHKTFEEKRKEALDRAFIPENILILCERTELVVFLPRYMLSDFEEHFPREDSEERTKKFYMECGGACPLCFMGSRKEFPPKIVFY